METASGFKPLTSSTTISLAPSQPSNSSSIIMSALNATGKQQQQPPPLQRALFEQAPFRRPNNLPGIPGLVPVAMNAQPSPNEPFLNAPTPTSSIESSQHPLPVPTFYPHFSGVDNLILAAKIQASSNETIPASSASKHPNYNPIYSSPSITASYSDYFTAYYQQQLMHQQQQQQQHQIQQQHQVQQQQMRDAVVLTPMTSRDNQSIANYDHQPRQPTPKNKHELELYELLKRANLLEYFGRFIKFGGDDVQQLAEADEQEFVEIMELVGMNHKPLHMRRMQKALNKWRQDEEETLEANENFRKPDALNDSGFYVNKVAQEYLSQHNTSLRSSSSLNDSLAPTSTGAARSLFPNESSNINNSVPESPQQQYNTPLEVIKNAPKKPRLMDNIKPSDLTKGIQIDNNGPLGSTPKKVKPHNKHFSGSPSSPASDYSPPYSPRSSTYSPASPTYSDISVDDGPVIQVSEAVKNPVRKLTGTSKRKRGLKKPSVATDLTRY